MNGLWLAGIVGTVGTVGMAGMVTACGGTPEPGSDDTTSGSTSAPANPSTEAGTTSDAPDSTDEGDTTSPGDGSSSETGAVPPAVQYEMPFAAGTRLHARVLAAEDGPATLLGWFDTMLQTDCTARFDRDGAMRCLPDPTPGYSPDGTTRLVYLDAACTEPALELQFGEAPAWVRVESEDPDLCGTQRPTYEVLEVGGTAPPPATVYEITATGCTPDGPVAGTLHQLQPSAPTQFVEMTRVVDGPRDRYTRDVRVGEDGSHQWWSIYDRELEEACTPAEIYGAWMCLSRDQAAPFPVSLGECGAQQGALGYGDASCGPPDLLREDGGFGTVTLYAMGDEVDPRDARVEVDGECLSLPDAPPPLNALRPYLRGEVQTTAELPPLPTVLPGDTRLRLHHYADEDGGPLFPASGLGWHDAELGNGCLPISIDVDERACIGALLDLGPDAFGWFSDAACSQPLVDDGLGLIARGPAIVLGRPAGPPDPSTMMAWMVGEPFVGDAYVQVGGSCMPTSEDGLYSLGEPVDLDQVPRLFTSVVGP